MDNTKNLYYEKIFYYVENYLTMDQIESLCRIKDEILSQRFISVSNNHFTQEEQLFIANIETEKLRSVFVTERELRGLIAQTPYIAMERKKILTMTPFEAKIAVYPYHSVYSEYGLNNILPKIRSVHEAFTLAFNQQSTNNSITESRTVEPAQSKSFHPADIKK